MSELRFRYLKASTELGALVLTLSPARLEGDAMAASLVEEILAAVAHAEAKKVVINLEHVQSLSSANFRPFLALRKHLQEVGGRMVLCNLSELVQESFQITQLTGLHGPSSAIFDVRPDVGAAAASLLRDPEPPCTSDQ